MPPQGHDLKCNYIFETGKKSEELNKCKELLKEAFKIDNNFATSLCEGNYHVTIYDINQCFLDIYFDIDPLMTNLESSIECSNNSFDGEIEVSASGGISPYIYIWNNFDLGEDDEDDDWDDEDDDW